MMKGDFVVGDFYTEKGIDQVSLYLNPVTSETVDRVWSLVRDEMEHVHGHRNVTGWCIKRV